MNSALKSNERVGFITGLNSPSLLRAVVWEFVYSFENIVQFAGRLARVRGQTGTCTFVTWEDAIQQYSKGDRDSLEVASALRLKSTARNHFYKTASGSCHSKPDSSPTSADSGNFEGSNCWSEMVGIQLHRLFWYLTACRCQERIIRGIGCILCGTSAQHNSMSCPRLFNRCYQCGEKGHGRAACTR
jgi:hypothetical protein